MPLHKAFDPPSMGPRSALSGMASGHLEPELQQSHFKLHQPRRQVSVARSQSPGFIQAFSVAVNAHVNDR